MSYKTWIGNKICLLWTNWVLSCKFMNEILYVIYLTHICVLKSFAKLVNSTTSLRCNLRIWTTVVILHWQFWRRMNALVLCAQTAKFILFEDSIQALLVWCLDLPTSSSFSRLMLMKIWKWNSIWKISYCFEFKFENTKLRNITRSES